MSKTEQNHNFIKLSPIIIYLFFAVIITGISSPKAELASKAEMDLVCQNWLAQIVHEQGNWAGQANPKVIRVEEFRSGDTLLATIHHIDPTGFILIPVLKEMVPIKAYSDKYNLDESQENGFLTLIRELFSSYLNLYIDNYGSLNQRQSLDNQIFDPKQKDEWMRLLQPGNEFKSSLLETRDRDAVEVGPLLTTSWHQKYPYNINSPIGSGGICDVGCVATAMAQILKHWEWPPRGSSNYTYYWGGDYSCGEPYTSGEFVTADLTNDYDWVNMPDSCDLGCSTVEVEALAEINFEAGVACRMQYGHCNSSAWHLGGSVEAYQKHFCYSREIQTAYRGDFT
ncbi:MAG: hypothetical protein GY855_09705, partial [candidate division Zixibacteria bacterium]|nr:hypothetical protein [candidate division Zixibacteria bacterium]